MKWTSKMTDVKDKKYYKKRNHCSESLMVTVALLFVDGKIIWKTHYQERSSYLQEVCNPLEGNKHAQYTIVST